jgi:hypothetical protein
VTEPTDSTIFPEAALAERARGEVSGVREGAKAPERTRVRLGAVAGLAASAVTLAVTTCVFLLLNKRFYLHDTGYDEEFFTWGGWCITKGLAPYRDFLEFKPPITFITHAMAIALFGLKNFGYRIFFTIVPLSAALLLQVSLIARGIERFLAMALMLGFLVLFLSPTYHDTALSDCESIGMAYYMFGLAFFLWEGRYAKITMALGGFFMCCCVLSKEPFGPVVVATWLGMFWLRGKYPSIEGAKSFVRYSMTGIAAFFLLLALYMVPTGAMTSYWHLIRSYSRIYRDPHTSYCVALGIAHADDGFQVAWEKIHSSFLNQSTLGYLAPLAIPGAIFAYRRSPFLFLTMVVAAVGGLWAATATNCMWIHYYNMSMAGVLYVLVAGADSLKRPLRMASKRTRIATSVAALGVIAWYLQPSIEGELKANYKRHPWHEPQPGLVAFITSHTVPSDRIFTTGTPQLYPQTDRISAVRETNIIDEILGSYEGATDEEKLRPIYEQLVTNKPKVVFLDPENEHRKGRHLRVLMRPFLAEFNYQKINDRLYLRP